MTTIYLIDDAGIYLAAQDIDPMSALPRCTLTPPPALEGEQAAQWRDGAWAVLPQCPKPVVPQYPKPVLPQYPKPVVPPEPVPASVSPRQIRQAMNRVPFGDGALRAVVEAAVAAGDQDLRDWWEFSTEVERSNPQVVAMGQALGMDDNAMDDLWRLAASL